ncbi:hypothetical protein ACKWTF_003402 [Chironomus riparius]
MATKQQQQKNSETKVQTRAGKINANCEEHHQNENNFSSNEILEQLASIKESLKAINLVLECNTSEAKVTNQSIKKLQNDVTKIDANLSDMRREIDENNEKLEVMGKNMDCSEEKVENQQKTIEQQAKLIKCQQSIINSLQQRNKSTQISIHNIPSHLDKDQVNKSISNWSKLDFSHETIKSASLVKQKMKHTANYYINFYSDIIKDRFMGFIKSKQRDTSKKYVPILCEHIFDIPEDDPCRGIEINVRIVMSDMNKKIFNRAREVKSLFEFVWLDLDGYINVKEKKDSKAIRVTSIEQLEEEITNKQQQNDESLN